MDFSTMSIWCWIIPLIVGVLCGIIGYLWGRGSVDTSGLTAELETLRIENSKFKSDLDVCKDRLASATAAAIPRDIHFDADAAKEAFRRRVKENDLKIVEGIGPKIEGLFHNFDIKTWHTLADTSVAKCQEVLDSGGDRFKVHDPASWPMQARMAYEGRWKELRRWQDEHNHGKL
jgi:predicted flap endonuclease-1-like 5' DNA nuclease